MKKEEKKYKSKEQEFPIVSEPVAVYQRTDTNSLKHRLIEEIMQIDNYDIIMEISDYLHELSEPSAKPPCQYSMKELRERIFQGEKDIAAGNYYTWEDIKAEWENED